MALGAGVFPAPNQEGEMIIDRETLRPTSLTASTGNSVCHCQETGWVVVEGKGAKECGCRVRAKAIRRLERIPPEYEHLRLESVALDLKRHPRQAFVWQRVKRHPEQCYLICGQPGTGKSAVMWALYAHAVEMGRPAVAMSLSELIEDFRRADAVGYHNEYLPELHPSKLQTRSERWFIGIDDFHLARPTRFAAEMTYRLLDAAYSYRHQLVVTSQLDLKKLERHWAEAGDGYGEAIMRRVLEIHGATYLTLPETNGKHSAALG
jgi:DNA replication protein DnaC